MLYKGFIHPRFCRISSIDSMMAAMMAVTWSWSMPIEKKKTMRSSQKPTASPDESQNHLARGLTRLFQGIYGSVVGRNRGYKISKKIVKKSKRFTGSNLCNPGVHEKDEKSRCFFIRWRSYGFFKCGLFFFGGLEGYLFKFTQVKPSKIQVVHCLQNALYICVFLNSLQFHAFGISAIAILDMQILSVFFLQATEWVFYLIWFCWYWLGLSPSHKCQSKNIWLDHFRIRGPCQILSSSKKSRIWALI